MLDTLETLEDPTAPEGSHGAFRLYTKLGSYEGSFVVGDTQGAVHEGDPVPYRKGELKGNATAELSENGLTICPVFAAPFTIAPDQIRGVVLNNKGTSKSSWGCERVINVLWEKDGDYLCTVLVIMYFSKSLPRDWQRALQSLARQTNAPEVPEAIFERVRLGFFDYKALSALMRNIFLAVAGTLILVWASIWAVATLVG